MPRVVVTGLDGASPDLVGRWMEEGHPPAMKEIAEEGAFGARRSTMPPLSPAAWSSFLTGMTPGNRGGFNFFPYEPPVYTSWQQEVFDTAFLKRHPRRAGEQCRAKRGPRRQCLGKRGNRSGRS